MLKLKCKPGDRAKIINGGNKCNIGLIVCVVRRYLTGECVAGTDWITNGSSWVVTSLGKPMTTIGVFDGTKLAQRTAVFDDVNLVPLDDNDDGLAIVAKKRKPRAKKQEARHE